MSTQPENELLEMQGVTERTVTVNVMERKIADGTNGEKQEISVPRKVFVKPISMRGWANALGLMTNVFAMLPSAGIDFSNPITLAVLVGKMPDEIFGVLELATDQTADFYDRIDLDDGIRVIQAVAKVNSDFFVQKVLPLLSEIAPALKEQIDGMRGQIESTLGQTE